jgi:hypothetical protein
MAMYQALFCEKPSDHPFAAGSERLPPGWFSGHRGQNLALGRYRGAILGMAFRVVK